MKHHLSICAIYRDEAPYLREWVEFHRLVGVEHFYLYNNGSTDEHREALAPFLEEGVAEVLEDFYPGQLGAYQHCLEERRDESRWIAFVDIDEFLFSPGAGRCPRSWLATSRRRGWWPTGPSSAPPGTRKSRRDW